MQKNKSEKFNECKTEILTVAIKELFSDESLCNEELGQAIATIYNAMRLTEIRFSD